MHPSCTMIKVFALSSLFFSMSFTSAAFAEDTGQYLDDAAITAKVKDSLLMDKEMKSMRVRVVTTQGNVNLSGTVDNSDQETTAVSDANRVVGVKSVKDNLIVGGM